MGDGGAPSRRKRAQDVKPQSDTRTNRQVEKQPNPRDPKGRPDFNPPGDAAQFHDTGLQSNVHYHPTPYAAGSQYNDPNSQIDTQVPSAGATDNALGGRYQQRRYLSSGWQQPMQTSPYPGIDQADPQGQASEYQQQHSYQTGQGNQYPVNPTHSLGFGYTSNQSFPSAQDYQQAQPQSRFQAHQHSQEYPNPQTYPQPQLYDSSQAYTQSQVYNQSYEHDQPQLYDQNLHYYPPAGGSLPYQLQRQDNPAPRRSTSHTINNSIHTANLTPHYGGPVSPTYTRHSLDTLPENAIKGDEIIVPIEVLDKSYKTRDGSFFVFGKVFAMLHTEPYSEATNPPDPRNDAVSIVRYGQKVFSNIRRFVVVERRRGFSYAFPVSTYGGRACTKQGVKSYEHAMIFTTAEAPKKMQGEGRMLDGIRVVTGRSDIWLDKKSRLNCSMKIAVQHNVKVKDLGSVHPDSEPFLESYRQMEKDSSFPVEELEAYGSQAGPIGYAEQNTPKTSHSASKGKERLAITQSGHGKAYSDSPDFREGQKYSAYSQEHAQSGVRRSDYESYTTEKHVSGKMRAGSRTDASSRAGEGFNRRGSVGQENRPPSMGMLSHYEGGSKRAEQEPYSRGSYEQGGEQYEPTSQYQSRGHNRRDSRSQDAYDDENARGPSQSSYPALPYRTDKPTRDTASKQSGQRGESKSTGSSKGAGGSRRK